MSRADAGVGRIVVTFPCGNREAKKYVVDQVFVRWLGIEAEVAYSLDAVDVVVSTRHVELARFPEILFANLVLSPNGISCPEPGKFCASVSVGDDRYEYLVPYAADCDHARRGLNGVDVFGSIFFILAGLDEYQVSESGLDRHERVRDIDKWQVRAGIELVPVIDCMVHELKTLFWDLGGQTAEPARCYMTCDLDNPFWRPRKSIFNLAKAIAVDCFYRMEPLLAFKRLIAWLLPRFGKAFDPYNTMEFMIQEGRREGWRFISYLLSGQGDGAYQGNVSFREKEYGDLVKQIHRDGSDIGLHVSYRASVNPDVLENEVRDFRELVGRCGLDQQEIFCRSHYLRWKPGVTERLYDDAGFTCDSSLAFSSRPGYRRGTARKFLLFNPVDVKEMPVEELPLLLMDVQILSSSGRVGRIAKERVLSCMKEFLKFSNAFGTPLTVLFHNSTLQTVAARKVYIEVTRMLSDLDSGLRNETE